MGQRRMSTINEQGENLAFSETENVYPKSYEDLCVFLEAFREPISSGDGKIYNADIGKAVWANIVTRKRPVNDHDTPTAESIYQLIGELGFNGDFPAMLYLYDRLDLSETEYNSICKDRTDKRSAILRWAKEVFSHAGKINAIHGNGNISVFQYVNTSDESDIADSSTYTTPTQNINGILALFGELAANKGKVGNKDEASI